MTTCRLACAAALGTLGSKPGNDASSLLPTAFVGETYRTLAIFEAALVKFGVNWLTVSNIRVTK